MLSQLCEAQSIQSQQHKNRLDSLAAKDLFSGIILAGADSTVVFHHSAGFSNRRRDKPISSNTTFEIASLTKQFTAAVVLKLYEKGLLSLHDSFGKYLGWYPDSYKNTVTIHQLLTHQSGIPNYTALPQWPSLSAQAFEKKAFAKRLLAGKPLQFTPGNDFSYSNSNYYLLGLIAEEVTKKPYRALLEEYIFTPLEMNDSGILSSRDSSEINLATGYERLPNGFVEKAPNQHYSTAFSVSGIYSTSENLFTWSKALANDTFLPDSIRHMMQTPHSNNYGYGLVISHANPKDLADMIRNPFTGWTKKSNKSLRMVWHWGSNPGYNTLFLRIPDKQLSVVILENLTQLNANTPTFVPDLAEKIVLDLLHLN